MTVLTRIREYYRYPFTMAEIAQSCTVSPMTIYRHIRTGPAAGPHTSAVQGAPSLRELRPRAGRSPWRGLYWPVGDRFVIAAVGPEAQHDPRGFTRACKAAAKRLSELEE